MVGSRTLRIAAVMALAVTCWAAAQAPPADTQPATTSSPATSRPTTTKPAPPASAPATLPAVPDEWDQRMARADAAIKLTQRIKKMAVGDATVAEFLQESPGLENALHVLLLAELRPAGQPRPEGGTFEIPYELPVRSVLAVLEEIRDYHDQGRRFRDVAFDEIGGLAPDKPLRQAGWAGGADLLTGSFIPRGPSADFFSRSDAKTRKFWLDHVTETGRVRAEARARGDASRRLVEPIRKLPIGERSLGPFAEEHGARTEDFRRFLRGARVEGAYYFPDVPVVTVRQAVSPRLVYASLKSWLHSRELPADELHLLERLIVTAGDAQITRIGIAPAAEDQFTRPLPHVRAALAAASAAPDWLGETARRTLAVKPSPTTTSPAPARPTDRAARDARVALHAQLAKLPVAEDVSVGELADDDVQLRTGMLALLQAAREVETVTEEGATRVTLELPLERLWRCVLRSLGKPLPTTLPAATGPATRSP